MKASAFSRATTTPSTTSSGASAEVNSGPAIRTPRSTRTVSTCGRRVLRAAAAARALSSVAPSFSVSQITLALSATISPGLAFSTSIEPIAAGSIDATAPGIGVACTETRPAVAPPAAAAFMRTRTSPRSVPASCERDGT